ncbi:putative ATP dependent RNA helicase [Hortaea werneckii]|nr:putative ATP dependent RNA helicase [Hortaea werneckii]
MADDGMLLNFELPSDAFAPKKTFKGGSWKDRLTAKKSAAYGRKKAQERAGGRPSASYGDVQSEDEELILPQGQPNKRAKTGEHSESKPRGERGPRGPHRGDTLPKTTNGEVISSLFTYNPSTTAKLQHAPEPAEDEAPVEPSNAPLNDELSSFTTLGLSSNLASHLLRKMNIQAPTAIQRKAVSQLCGKDSDAFIQAQTGSGKTLAYLLPIVQRITDISKKMHDAGQDFSRECGLFAIVLAPTRELSKQISTVLESLLSCCHWIVGGTVIGGEKKKSEKARLRKGLNILVATPGRLADHLNNTEVLDVSRVRWLVLDEGDRLMELGFENDIQKIVSVLNLRSRKAQETPTPGLPDRRTTVLCSATIKANVEQLRSIALKDPASIAVDAEEAAEAGMDTKEQAFTAPAQLKQSYAVVPAKQRLVTLVAVLKQAFKRKGSVMKSIVFMSCADSVDFHFELLTRKEESKSKDSSKENQAESAQRKRQAPPKLSKSDKIPQGNTISEARTYGPATAVSSPENDVQVFRLHGSLQQATRTSTLKAFTKCTEPAVLVCTDVASRGLDLPNVDLVIEYDPPFSKDDHLHRVGRTARAGKDGRAMIFLIPGCEEGYVDILKEGKPRNLTRHDADELLKKGFSPSTGVVADKSWEQEATEWQLEVERWISEDPKHLEQARRAYQSHIRAYATHVAAERPIFNMQELHLGHLAKAFALRDKPGSIRVPGQRPGAAAGAKTKESRKAQAGKAAAGAGSKRPRAGEDFDTGATDEQDARRKMMAKMKAMSGASEFNLG